MNSSLCFILLLLLPFYSKSQEPVAASDYFTVNGAVDKEIIINAASLDSFKPVPIPDLIITNHLGEKRSTAAQMRGILLKNILQTVTINQSSPKLLSEYYFLLIASDNYKVVFSWNEIFNSETGNHLYLVTRKGGKALAEMPERMLIICTTDFKTGRRYIKGLQQIQVYRADASPGK